jgi:rubrerythrin
MATFICKSCGAKAEVRCKPKKCPKCAKEGTMEKK